MSDSVADPTAAPSWHARLLRFPLTRIAIALLCIGVPFALAGLLVKSALPGEAWRGLRGVFGTVVLVASYWVYVRKLEQRALSELSWPGAWKELLAGLLVGSLLFTAVMGLLYAFGALRITGQQPWAAAGALVPTLVLAAIAEEIVFRGVIFRILEQWLGSWMALALSALLFGFAHAGNPGASLLTSSAIAIEAGFLLGGAYMLTRRLWFVTALHFAWNFMQGGVFSIAVSGQATKGRYETRLTGPDWLTGGAFGAEASVVAIVCCVLLSAVLLLAVARRSGFVAAFWRRRAGTAAAA